MTALQTKAVRPTRNKLVLQLPGATEEFPMLIFARAKRQAVPSLKKECKANYDPSDPKSGTVKQMRSYKNPLRPDEEVCTSHTHTHTAVWVSVKRGRIFQPMFGVSNAQVQAENLVKGYKFGPDHVPVSAADAESMKVESDKPYLQILGFASADSVQISDSIGDTKCLIPGDGSTRSEAALGSLAAALHSQGRVAIARFVSRKNTDPQLVRAAYMIGEMFAALQSGYITLSSLAQLFFQMCLRPDPEVAGRADMQQSLLCWQLPFFDDQRRFNFPSFDRAPPSQQPSAAQLASASALVSAMGLDEQAFRPENTFNPLMQRLRRATVARAKDETCQLPGVDPRVRAYMDPKPAVLRAALPAVEQFRANFKFVTVEVVPVTNFQRCCLCEHDCVKLREFCARCLMGRLPRCALAVQGGQETATLLVGHCRVGRGRGERSCQRRRRSGADLLEQR